MVRSFRFALAALLALAAPSAFAQGGTVVDGSQFVAVRGWNGTDRKSVV